VQEWVFDRDGARTGHEPIGTAGRPPEAVPVPRRRGLGRRGRWLVAAVAALAVLTGGIAVAATTGDPAPEAAESTDPAVPQAQAPEAVPPAQTLPDGESAAQAAPESALHEERQVEQPDGTTVTVALQGGTVTALTADSVTVESSDGYSRTYAVTADTRIAPRGATLDDLAAGDAVLVEAVVEGDTATAATIRAAPAGGGSDEPDTGTSSGTEDA
jgi:hypothetical protein